MRAWPAIVLTLSACHFFELPDGVLYLCDDGACPLDGYACVDGRCVPADGGTGGGTAGGTAGGSPGGGAGGGSAGGAAGGTAGGMSGCSSSADCPALLTCGGDGDAGVCALDVTFCNSTGWCWERPTPQGKTLAAVTALPSGAFWAAGEDGTLLQLSDAGIARLRTPSAESFTGIWARAGSDEVWLVGDAGTRLRFADAGWTVFSSASPRLFSIIGERGSPNVFAGGANGALLKFDGQSWQPLTALATGCDVAAFVELADAGLLAGCDDHRGTGPLFAYAGSTWSNVPDASYGASSLALAGDRLFFVTNASTVRSLPLAALGAADAAVPEAVPATIEVAALAADPTSVWAVGKVIAGSRRTLWRRESDAGWVEVAITGDSNHSLALTFARGIGVAVGRDGMLLRISDAGATSLWHGSGPEAAWSSVWVDSTSVSAGGSAPGLLNGYVGVRAPNAQWALRDTGYVWQPVDVWSPHSGEVIGGGLNGYFYALSENFTPLHCAFADCDGGSGPQVRGIWGVNDTDWFVGAERLAFTMTLPGGVSRHLADGGWQSQDVGNADVLEVNGSDSAHVTAVGRNGVIYTSPGDGGTAWVYEGRDGGDDLFGVWMTSSQQGWACGDYGTVLERGADGGWSSLAPPMNRRLNGVWADHPGDVWFAGEQGAVLHLLGDGGWQAEETGTRAHLLDIGGRRDGGVWVVGDRDVILRRQ